MFVNGESFSTMFKLDMNLILSSREFQPYVILKDILDRKYRNVLREKNIKVSGVGGQTNPGQLKQDILPIEKIKTEIKEEEFSELIEDISSSANGLNTTVSCVQGQTELRREHDILQIDSIKTEIKEEEFSEQIEDISSSANGLNTTVSCVQGQTELRREHDNLQIDSIKTEIKEEEFSEQIEDISFAPRESQDVTTSKNQLIDSVFQSIGVNEDGESCNSLQNIQPLEEVSTAPERVDEDIEDWSSLDLHLSPDSVDDDHDNTGCDNEEVSCYQNNQSERTSQDDISMDTSSILASTCSSGKSKSREQIPPAQQCSLDMFAESPEGSGAALARTSSSSTCPSVSSDVSNAGEDNREPQEEWNSQELSMVSLKLRLRSQQAKRLILEVIRKRQMVDETLESFKKRLRRM